MKWLNEETAELYKPERLVRVLDNGALIIDGEEATLELRKVCRAEAKDLSVNALLAKLLVTLRRDAVRIGIEEMTQMEQAHYAKAVFFVTGLLESYIKEISKLKVE